MAPLRFLYDCDPGADDALAMLLALGRPDALDMIAVTCVAGNVGLRPVVNNARRILELCGRRDIPVYAGAARPIMASRGRVSIMHGSDGLAGSKLPAPTMPVTDGHAATEISRIARAEGKLHICATGPMTNLALALLLDPDLPDFISAINIMGGAAFCPGNTTPLAEFNFAVDPHAAAIVFDSGIPITMLGLDVTRQATVNGDMIAQVGAIDSAVAREAAHLLINYGSKDPCLHDPAAIAWMLKPEIFKTVQAHVSICTNSGPAAGQVVAAVSERHLSGRAPNSTIVTHVDAAEFRKLFVASLL
ncbi:nucleoside hydrolase [Agrobacterium vitis]|uniref:nucleoside hydrolase n=1 Tax=Agrobacterium vitis TaxID=373 RepID=UPI000871EF27|nr:nucleoside hydrolase [Agrobacterium vitis]MCE6076757.1 nucleoside hydrolase [Agrobacterium vitis]MCM2471063.1 nucleoside hydrolase [Agrobacterium vitis]MUO71142.1 nucleoside hydrolase [Agrobacterium vitis]MUO84395.1 nucleoside hydrolase [Agrobacterium vitis]